MVLEAYETRVERPYGLDRPTADAGPARPVAVCWPDSAPGPPPGGGKTQFREARMLPLSGKSARAVRELARRYLRWLDARVSDPSGETPDSGGDGRAKTAAVLADMAWTAGVGRSHFGHRSGLTFAGVSELRDKLNDLAGGGAVSQGRNQPTVAFLFTGQGSQWVGMGSSLYETEPVARAVLERCDAAMRGLRGVSLLDVMFGRDGAEGDLNDTAWTQPALYALECAVAALWNSVGVRPVAVMGHSVGELAAAQVAGVFGLEDGLRFASARGELMSRLQKQGSSEGAMAAVFAPGESVVSAVREANLESEGAGLSVAADNGAHQVVSGPAESVGKIAARFVSDGVRVERLNSRHAFHSVLMDPILDDLEAALDGVRLAAPGVVMVSNVTGRPVPESAILDGAYWRRQAREPVAFARGVAALAEIGVEAVVEIGPHAVLGPMAEFAWPGASGDAGSAGSGGGAGGALSPGSIPLGLIVLTSEMRPSDEAMGQRAAGATFAQALAAAYSAGVDLTFESMFAGEERRRVSLPSYPFQRDRYWLSPTRPRVGRDGHPLLGTFHESAGGEVTFEKEMLASNPAWLGDHRVFGRVVAPAALHGALAAAAASAAAESSPIVVEDLRLHGPLVFDQPGEEFGFEQSGRSVQVILGRSEEGSSRSIEVFSKGVGEETWTLHAEGSAQAGSGIAGPSAGIDLDTLRESLSQEDVAAFYRSLAAAEVELGTAFRGVQAVWSGVGEALGEVALPPGVDGSGMLAHPALLDGCFQVLAAIDDGGQGDRRTTYMPIGWERLWLRGPFPERVLSHVRVREAGGPKGPAEEGGAAGTPDVLTADVWIHDPAGAVLGEVSGFTVKRATRLALLSAVERIGGLMYGVSWRDATSAGSAEEPTGCLLLVDGDTGDSMPLAAALGERGAMVMAGFDSDPERLLMSALDGASGGESAGSQPAGAGNGGFAVEAGGTTPGISAGVSGIVVAVPSWSGQIASATDTLQWLLGLVRAMLAADMSPPLGLTVLTTAGVAVEPSEPVDPVAASIWGFARSLQVEQPGVGVRLLDIGPTIDDSGGWPYRLNSEGLFERASDARGPCSGALANFAAEAILTRGGEPQLALRGERLLVPRLERERLRLPVDGGRLLVSAHGSRRRFAIVAAEDREPGAGEVTIAVRACGLAPPGGPGSEAAGEGRSVTGLAGVVIAAGPKVDHVGVGDAVFGLAAGEAASRLTTSASLLRRIPAGLDFARAATAPAAFVMAAAGLKLAEGQLRKRVLVHAVGIEAVGLATAQLAKASGADVYVTAAAKLRARLEALGASYVPDGKGVEVAQEILSLTGGEGVGILVCAPLGSEALEASLSCLAPQGCFLEVAAQKSSSANAVRARPSGRQLLQAGVRRMDGLRGGTARWLPGSSDGGILCRSVDGPSDTNVPADICGGGMGGSGV